MLLVFRVCHYHGPAGKGTRHLDYRAKTAVDRSERKHRVAVMPAMPEGQPEPTLPDVAVTDAAVAVGTSEKREVTGVSRLAPVVTPVVNNGLDVAGAQVTRPAARTWRSFGFLRYPSRDLKSHWRSLRAASLKPLDIPATVSVKKRAAALACHRFVIMEWSVSTGEPVARMTS